MRKASALLLLSILFLSLVRCTKEETEFDYTNWRLVWEDNFDGDSLDSTKWSVIPRGTSDWSNYMSDYEELIEVKNSNLILRGMVNDVLPNDTAPYLTGGVYTKNKKKFGFGRLEIRAKLSPATGAWPAFWMLPSKLKWLEGGEIDIIERLGHQKAVYHTVHTEYTLTLGITNNPTSHAYIKMNPDVFNIYALEKHPDKLIFFINNIKTFTYPRIDSGHQNQFPFADDEFYLLLGMQLGGSWVGSVKSKELPVEIFIDWVRFYEFIKNDD